MDTTLSTSCCLLLLLPLLLANSGGDAASFDASSSSWNFDSVCRDARWILPVDGDLSNSSLTGLCHAQCIASCLDFQKLSDNEENLECSENCSIGLNSTRSTEGEKPNKPTPLSLRQVNVTVVRVTWSPSEVRSPEATVVYVTERRSSNGQWTVVSKSTNNWTDAVVGVCEKVSFRVAAVNEFGFKGFTEPIFRSAFPVPGKIIDAKNTSMRLKFDTQRNTSYIHYKFKFYLPEEWIDARPKDDFIKRSQCTERMPPYLERNYFDEIDRRTYIYRAQVKEKGFTCNYTINIFLESTCRVKGEIFPIFFDPTTCDRVLGMYCTTRASVVEESTTSPLPRTPSSNSFLRTISPFGVNDSLTSAVLISEKLTAEGGQMASSYLSVGVTAFVVVVLLLLTLGCVMYRRRTYRRKRSSAAQIQNSLGLLELKPNVYYKSVEEYFAIVARDDWEIPRESIVLGEVLGQGAFGRVHKALLRIEGDFLRSRCELVKSRNDNRQSDQITVAVKMLTGDEIDLHRSDFLREMELMRTIGYHGNVVNMIGCCTRDEPLCLVVEHVALGDLLRFLQTYRARYQLQARSDRNFEYFTLWDLMNFALQISFGMEFLSKKGFVHRDLAARNVLVAEDRRVLKIGDFGLTRYIYDDQVYVANRGGKLPFKWMALESIFDLTFTTASDVWSYGIVLYELLTLGGTPYPTIQHRDLLRELQRGYRMERPAVNCSPALYQLMLSCWEGQPTNRPNFTELRVRIEAMLDQLKDTPDAFARVLPIDEYAYENRLQRSSSSSSSSSSIVIQQ